MLKITISTIILLSAYSMTLAADASTADAVTVLRTTRDRDQDLIDALIRNRQWDTALEIADFGARNSEPSSDLAAHYAIRRSQIETARRRTIDDFGDSEIELAQEPISELLNAYPDHRRKWFLEAAALDVLIAAAEHDLLAVVVNRAESKKADRTLRRLTRLSTELGTLYEQIRAQRAILDSQRTEPRDLPMIEEFDRLSQEILVALVRVGLLGSEMFPAGSRDRIAAATIAVDAAEDALQRLPSRCDARWEVNRLRVVALEQSDNFVLARSEWERLSEEISSDTDLRFKASGIRIELRSGNRKETQQRLESFYGNPAARATVSIDMDLVCLEYLIEDDQANGVRISQWIDKIGDRHGPYGRRRAEAILLSRLKPHDNSDGGLPPSIVAAQGRQSLREDQPLRAAQLLARAASVEQNPDQAISLSIESAAAFIAADRSADAAAILMQTAVDQPTAKRASVAHLQSTVLAAKSNLSASETKTRLQETIILWPDTVEAQQAARWLINLYQSENQIVEAAETATRMLLADPVAADLDTAVKFWAQALRETHDSKQQHELMSRLNESFAPLLDHEDVFASYRRLAIYYFDRSDLLAIDSARMDSENEEESWLYQFRRSPRIDESPHPQTSELRDIIVWRLMRDAVQDHSLRKLIAQEILTWPHPETDPLGHAERLVWTGKLDAAMETIETILVNSNDQAQTLSQAATMLGQANQPDAKRQAVKLWDRLASGLPVGSVQWHEAKLAAIETLFQAGDVEESRTRVNYILLTTPPTESELQQRYHNFVKS